MLTAKKTFLLWIASLMLAMSLPASGEAGFDIIFVDVGQGDCTIIKCDGKSMVIDAGTKDKGMDIQEALFKLDIGKIDIVAATHPDRDHNSYLDELISLYAPRMILLPPVNDKTSNTFYQAVIDAADQFGLLKEYPFVGDTYELGSAKITVYGPHPVLYSQEDNWSLVLMVEYQGIHFLLTGDTEAEAEEDMLKYNSMYPLKADVLKVAKHGSDNASTYDFIAAVSPQIAVIPCGENNRYDFPHGDVIMTLLDNGIEDIRVTWKEGDVHLAVVDGQLSTVD